MHAVAIAPRPGKKVNRPMTRLRRMTGPLRVLPDFLIIGAQKCGTSSLYRYLVKHPSVAPCLRKEVHFFDWHFQQGPHWYRAHFPTAAYREMVRVRTGQRPITGEASPYYLFHPHVPGRVKALLPNVKLVALLRDPVDRAVSAYHHQVRRGRETMPLIDAITDEPARLAGHAERFRNDGRHNSLSHRRFSYLARGIYADQLQGWLRLFPREQLLIIRSEDFFQSPAAVFADVLQFLGLPRCELPRYAQSNAGQYPEIDPEARKWLTDYFAPHNRQLYDLVGRDFGWTR